MKYFLSLLPRPFEAIKNGTKTIEGRAPKDSDDNRYADMKPGDTILFTHEETGESLEVRVTFVRYYKNVKAMLEEEGTEHVLSSKETVEEGIETYHSLDDYKQRIEKFGIYAIGIKVVD